MGRGDWGRRKKAKRKTRLGSIQLKVSTKKEVKGGKNKSEI